MLLKKYGIHIALIIACALIIIVPLTQNEVDPEKIRKANVAATNFLELVDAGEYETARKEGATILKEKETLDSWISLLASEDIVLGEVLSRNQIKSSYSTTALKSPDGEYVTLTFKSDYTHKKEITETIVVMIDKNRGWRVAGYFRVIRK